MTEYVILRLADEEPPYDEREMWEVGLHVTARSVKSAIESGSAGKSGQYVAVPVRNWKPLPVKVDTHTVITVG